MNRGGHGLVDIDVEYSFINITAMKTQKYYLLSFGNSNKYYIPFDGSLDEFKNSDELKRIKEAVYGFAKDKLPEVKYKHVLNPKVEELYGNPDEYMMLNASNMDKLKDDVLRQLEVKEDNRIITNDAPYADSIKERG